MSGFSRTVVYVVSGFSRTVVYVVSGFSRTVVYVVSGFSRTVVYERPASAGPWEVRLKADTTYRTQGALTDHRNHP